MPLIVTIILQQQDKNPMKTTLPEQQEKGQVGKEVSSLSCVLLLSSSFCYSSS
jgi:hypothetical protein